MLQHIVNSNKEKEKKLEQEFKLESLDKKEEDQYTKYNQLIDSFHQYHCCFIITVAGSSNMASNASD
jgi:hypothetical protein